MRLQNRQGFMLVQVLVGAGIMAAIGMAMASMMNDMWKQSSSLQAKQNEMTFIDTVKQQLATSLLCRTNLVNKANFSVSGDREMEVRIPESVAAVKSGTRLDNLKIQVDRLYMSGIRTAISSVNNETVYAGDIYFQGQELAGSKMQYRQKSLGVIFMKVPDGTTNITDCYLAESSDNVLENACRGLGGVMQKGICNMSSLKEDIAKTTCQKMKGTYVNGQCNLLASMGSCPAGKAASGFDSSGNIICKSAASKMCEFKTDASAGYVRNRPTTCCSPAESSNCIFIDSNIHTSPGGNTTGGSRYICNCT